MKKIVKKGGFTLIEVMVVVVIIGILASLAYSSLIELIFTNRAKETAQIMRTFAERSLAEAKRQKLVVEISLDDNSIVAKFKEDQNSDPNENLTIRQPLSDGFSRDITVNIDAERFAENKVTSKQTIGVSGLTKGGAFVACGGRGYCGAIVKEIDKNSFEAKISKDNGVSWRKI
jgi:prepilin-type N-terminal cleavage/methylation domain-containing protein